MSGQVQRRRIIKKNSEGISPGHLTFNDFYNRPIELSRQLENLIRTGALTNGVKGKLQINIRPLDLISPWYHIRRTTSRHCGLWQDIYFSHFNFVHSGCRRCWKTALVTDAVPRQQKVYDLFRLRDLLISLNMPSKCGVDTRLYTPNRYAGFIYADSLDQAGAYYEIMCKHFKELFPHGKVVVKLACTEFEHKFGPTDEWFKFVPHWDAMERYLDYLIEGQSEQYNLGLLEHADADTFRFWIEYAHGIGDPSWKQALKREGYSVPERLFFKAKTYHKE